MNINFLLLRFEGYKDERYKDSNVHPSTAAYRAMKASALASIEFTALSNAAKKNS